MVLSIDQWKGKLAVVTGASAGIGAAIAKILVENDVVGLARRVNQIESTVSSSSIKNPKNNKAKLYAIKCDISDENDVKNAFIEINKIAPIHILINNAATFTQSTLYNGNVADWKKILDLNVIGTCTVTKEAIRIMSENKIDGQIININSILGHFSYNIPNSSIYPASKFALTSLTETLRMELIGIGSKIKISSISPGPVENTDFAIKENCGENAGGPLKYFLKPEDVGNAVLYILSTAPHFHVAELMLRPVGELY